ncbi:hypothetical protein HD806DRAFT_536378 [Xylariaceae sp. AK1471]|nr:hypothetical protein HD806DRAFT_536378 [Xylariaceae sp. AK1471]
MAEDVISSYRIRKDDLEAFLKKLFGDSADITIKKKEDEYSLQIPRKLREKEKEQIQEQLRCGD